MIRAVCVAMIILQRQSSWPTNADSILAGAETCRCQMRKNTRSRPRMTRGSGRTRRSCGSKHGAVSSYVANARMTARELEKLGIELLEKAVELELLQEQMKLWRPLAN